jgi:hypothetical protein
VIVEVYRTGVKIPGNNGVDGELVVEDHPIEGYLTLRVVGTSIVINLLHETYEELVAAVALEWTHA